MKKALYPGTFDPLTNGHMDIIRRTLKLFDEVIVAVSDHSKKSPLFSVEERCMMIEEAMADTQNLTVIPFNNLTVNFARQQNAFVIIRGLRVSSDFEYEFTMARFMAEQDRDMEVMYLMAGENKLHISSSRVKEIAKLGGDVSNYVPKIVQEQLEAKHDNLCAA